MTRFFAFLLVLALVGALPTAAGHNEPIACSQLPAHTGGVTSSAGSCATTIGTSQTITTPNIVGTTAVGNATAGSVGERIDSTAALSSVSLSTGTAANITSISLTAGDWEVDGIIYFSPGASTSVTALGASIGTASNTLNQTIPQFAGFSFPGTIVASNIYTSLAVPSFRINISSTTTYYFVGYATFSVSTVTAGGSIHAVRVR